MVDFATQQINSEFRDQYGWVMHKEKGKFEGGDSAQRTFMMWCFDWFSDRGNTLVRKQRVVEACYSIRLFENDPRRHPGTGEWWNLPGNFSLDQLRPIICALVLYDARPQIRELFGLMSERGGWAWNRYRIGQKDGKAKLADFMGMIEWGLFWRSFARQTRFLLSPLTHLKVYLSDLTMGLYVLLRCLLGWLDPDDVGDDLNLFVMLLTTRYVKPTLISRLNCELYKALRPESGTELWRTSLRSEYQHARDAHPEIEPLNAIGMAFHWYFQNKMDHPPIGWIANQVAARHL